MQTFIDFFFHYNGDGDDDNEYADCIYGRQHKILSAVYLHKYMYIFCIIGGWGKLAELFTLLRAKICYY